MRRFVLVAIGVVAVTGCARQPHPSAINPANEYLQQMQVPTPLVASQVARTSLGEINEKTDSELNAWFNCVFDHTSKYMQANEAAEVTVRAAMTSCHRQESDLQNAISLVNGSSISTNELMNIRRKVIFENLVQIVIEQRINLMTAHSLSRAWTDCLVDRTVENSATDISEKEILIRSYSACEVKEGVMRRQLASFNKNADAIIEDRKRRVLPILRQFVIELKNTGKPAKRPDLQT